MTELNLGFNKNIGTTGATAIAQALNVNQSVTVLNNSCTVHLANNTSFRS